MDIAKGYAGVTLEWLYNTVEERSRLALLNSHSTFLAARKIQRVFRQWYSEVLLQRQSLAITIVQKYCRGWLTRKTYYKFLKYVFLERLMCYYNMMATRIQAYWRGYWSREHIHDHTKLRKAQEEAAKQLIICIAHRLHYMLRTRITPGVYSIRNTHCLSKVERLLASMKFTNYSRELRKLDEDQLNLIQKSIENTDTKAGMVKVPYLDGYEACNKIGGNKMTTMLDKYHYDSKREDELVNKKTCSIGNLKKTIDKNKLLKKKTGHGKKKLRKKNICTEIVNSLTNWGIVKDDKRFIVCPGIVENPEKIIGFLTDIQSVMSKTNL